VTSTATPSVLVITRSKRGDGSSSFKLTELGAQGPAGENGTAVAYAHVLSNGMLDTAHSKNVTAATAQSGEEECLKTSVPVVNATAGVDVGGLGIPVSTIGSVSVVLGGQDPNNILGLVHCPAGDNVLVLENPAHRSFWISFN
jgi:hypothetical protein